VDPTRIPLPIQEESLDNTVDIETDVEMPAKMPSPYGKEAPKFHWEKPEELNRFIRRVEELFTANGVDDDKEKIKYLCSYADPRTEREWFGMNSHTEGVWAKFKKEVIDSYPEASNETRGSMKELKRIRDNYSGISPGDLSKLQAFKRSFTAEAKKLRQDPPLLSNHESVEFFMTPLTESFRKQIYNKLDIADLIKPSDEIRRPEDRFALDKIVETAVSIAQGSQASYGSLDPTPLGGQSERNLRAKMKLEDDLVGNILANLQDQQRNSEKTVMGAIEQMNKNFQQVQHQLQQNNSRQAAYTHQAPVVQNFPNQSYQPQGSRQPMTFKPMNNAAGNSCFYCGEEGHMRDECVHRNEHALKGWITIDGRGRTLLPDGRPIPFASNTTQRVRVEALNGAARVEKPSAGVSQNLMMGRPGILQLSHAITTPAPQHQGEIEDELEKYDLNDLYQFLATRSGRGTAVEDEFEEGFR
jgi:hypothetical protein